MKTIKVYEFKDLDKKIQKKVRENHAQDLIDSNIEILTGYLERKEITEKEYYSELGCSKEYAESTPWFIPACYYEKHKTAIEQQVTFDLANMLFSQQGLFIQWHKK